MDSLWNDLQVDRFRFHGGNTLSATTSPFRQATTGTPGNIVAVNGSLRLPLAATTEVECNRLHMGVTPYRIADLVWAKFVVACTADLGAASQVAFGLGKTLADDPDSLDEGVWFKAGGDHVVVMESDDGTTDVDDIATGITLGATFQLFYFDFRNGVWTNDPRGGGSYGGESAIQASVMNSTTGKLRPVARGTRFTLGAAVGGLQPFAQIAKSSASDTGYLYVQEIEIAYKRSLYAAA
jgi:hypothetical protein